MIPRRVQLATLFAFLLHGLFILTARYRLSYDAYIHMFFGDHYRGHWWSLWDPRWYTGFLVSSYPPLVHQLIGLLSHLTGLDVAFALILWITVALFPLAIYSFALIFVRRQLAEIASLGGAFLPSVYLSAHIFGQLPFLFATMVALFGGAAFAQFIRSGRRLDAALGVALMAVVMASHHAVLLFLPFLFFAIALHSLLLYRVPWHFLAVRAGVFVLCAVAAMLLVSWPFWDWGRGQTMQVPIDHLSRHNFFAGWPAPAIFFLPMYGPLMVLIPWVLRIGTRRRFISLMIPFMFLFLLGLGGTTPLPRWLFGRDWEWLTYDRFSVWASITMLPCLGLAINGVRRGIRAAFWRARFPSLLFGSLAIFCFLVAGYTTVMPTQPGAVDLKQIVRFLAQGDRSKWRYLTFGFGDQLAFLSTMTTATTIDGSYHTARALPELRDSGLAQIDTAYWSLPGLAALDPVLKSAGGYGVRWGFVNVPYYVPVLQRNGWKRVTTLKGGVQVWENPGAIPPAATDPAPGSPLASFSWGTLPLLALLSASALGTLRVRPLAGEKGLRAVHAFLIGLLPLGVCFWYYRQVGDFSHARVYFTYDHALFFLADGLAIPAVTLWLAQRAAQPRARPLTSTGWLLLSLCGLASLSVLWSVDWHTSLYIAIHLWLVAGLAFSLRDWPAAWRPWLLGLCAALSIQAFTGFGQFAAQSTALLAPLQLKWPGLLDPSVRGASVIGLPEGSSILRAYGTLPHPNILGGFALLCLFGPVALYLRRERSNSFALLLVGIGMALIGLTFSRSAWIALAASALVLAWKSRYFDRRRLIILALVAGLSLVLTLVPLRTLVAARTFDTSSHSEQFSGIARSWLAGQAVQMIQSRPLTGFGTGGFVLRLARTAGEDYIIEPVHNLLLLLGAELGIPGMLLLIAIVLSIARRIAQAVRPESILAGTALTGLGVVSLFDHYLWTLAPGRLMLGLALGIWMGQVERDA